MTFAGWIIYAIIAFVIVAYGLAFVAEARKTKAKVVYIVIIIALLICLLCGMMWFFHNTASGQRQLVDQKSNLANGLNRTIKVYAANGDVIAEYSGVIDIEANDGGYIKFDFEGKRYMYYNCFVESIADIE